MRRDLPRVIGLPRAAFGQLDHRAAAHVGIAIDPRDVLAVPLDVVEHHALAQRQIAERDFFGAERPSAAVSSSTAPATIRSARRGSSAGQVHALLEIHFDDGLAQPAQALRRHAQVAHFLRHRTAIDRGRDRAERQDRARRADDAIEALLDDVLEVAIDLLADELRSSCVRRGSLIGSESTNRSVRRMTPILKLRANSTSVLPPSVISTLPPPMSMTTAGFGVSTP